MIRGDVRAYITGNLALSGLSFCCFEGWGEHEESRATKRLGSNWLV